MQDGYWISNLKKESILSAPENNSHEVGTYMGTIKLSKTDDKASFSWNENTKTTVSRCCTLFFVKFSDKFGVSVVCLICSRHHFNKVSFIPVFLVPSKCEISPSFYLRKDFHTTPTPLGIFPIFQGNQFFDTLFYQFSGTFSSNITAVLLFQLKLFREDQGRWSNGILPRGITVKQMYLFRDLWQGTDSVYKYRLCHRY